MSDSATSQSVPGHPSPLRVAVFLLMALLAVSSFALQALAPRAEAAKRLEASYYATMGDLLTRLMLGLESLEEEGAAPTHGYSADAVAEAAAGNYALALAQRQDDLALRISLATVYWHIGLRAEKQMFALRAQGRAAEAQDQASRAGDFKTKAIVNTLTRGLEIHPGNPTIRTLVFGLDPRMKIAPQQVEDPNLQRIAARIAPGHLLLSLLYQDVGMAQRARAEREKAYIIGGRALWRLTAGVFCLVIGMLAGLLIWIVLLVRRVRRVELAADLGRTPWSVWRAVEVLILLVFLQGAFGPVRARLVAGGEPASTRWIASAVLVYLAAGIGAIAWLMLTARPGGLSLRDLGWRRIGLGAAVGTGLAGYLASMPVVYPVLAVISRFVDSSAPSSPIVPVMMSASGLASRALLVVLTVVVAPLVEETIFRGVLYPALRRRMRLGWAALISGLLFAAVHGEPVAFVSLALLGMVLAYVYERTGSLWAPVITHAVFNAASVAAVYFLMV